MHYKSMNAFEFCFSAKCLLVTEIAIMFAITSSPRVALYRCWCELLRNLSLAEKYAVYNCIANRFVKRLVYAVQTQNKINLISRSTPRWISAVTFGPGRSPLWANPERLKFLDRAPLMNLYLVDMFTMIVDKAENKDCFSETHKQDKHRFRCELPMNAAMSQRWPLANKTNTAAISPQSN